MPPAKVPDDHDLAEGRRYGAEGAESEALPRPVEGRPVCGSPQGQDGRDGAVGDRSALVEDCAELQERRDGPDGCR